MTVQAITCFDAGIESIKYRQALSPVGGIVESDPRVDRGNYLYADRCWLRNYHVEPLLAAGEVDVVLKNLEYWSTVFASEDGCFHHNYHHQTGKSSSRQIQIDNNAHYIHHLFLTVQSIGKGDWISNKLEILRQCANYLCGCLDEKEQMLLGQEERVIEGIEFPLGYSFYINRVCVSALYRAAEIGAGIISGEELNKWREIALIVENSIRQNLWDDRRQCYAYFKFLHNADHARAGELSHDESWGLLWAYIHNNEYEERDRLSVHNRLNALYGVDPKLPEFICQKEPSAIKELLSTGDDKPAFHYSGVGVCPAANAVAAWIVGELEKNETLSRALWKPLERLNCDYGLIPEHINTMHPGRMKDYELYPSQKSHVDSGNLMHLTMYMTAAIRLGLVGGK